MNADAFDVEARRVISELPSRPCVVVIGSSSFWNAESPGICSAIGNSLADAPELVLVTGGRPGVGEAVGRAFHARRAKVGRALTVFHVLPRGESQWGYGTTIFAGDSVAERREILGRISQTYLAIEGGRGTEHESLVASANAATVIPVGRSGGHAAQLHARGERPCHVSMEDWGLLSSSTATPQEVAQAACRAILACLAR